MQFVRCLREQIALFLGVLSLVSLVAARSSEARSVVGAASALTDPQKLLLPRGFVTTAVLQQAERKIVQAAQGATPFSANEKRDFLRTGNTPTSSWLGPRDWTYARNMLRYFLQQIASLPYALSDYMNLNAADSHTETQLRSSALSAANLYIKNALHAHTVGMSDNDYLLCVKQQNIALVQRTLTLNAGEDRFLAYVLGALAEAHGNDAQKTAAAKATGFSFLAKIVKNAVLGNNCQSVHQLDKLVNTFAALMIEGTQQVDEGDAWTDLNSSMTDNLTDADLRQIPPVMSLLSYYMKQGNYTNTNAVSVAFRDAGLSGPVALSTTSTSDDLLTNMVRTLAYLVSEPDTKTEAINLFFHNFLVPYAGTGDTGGRWASDCLPGVRGRLLMALSAILSDNTQTTEDFLRNADNLRRLQDAFADDLWHNLQTQDGRDGRAENPDTYSTNIAALRTALGADEPDLQDINTLLNQLYLKTFVERLATVETHLTLLQSLKQQVAPIT